MASLKDLDALFESLGKLAEKARQDALTDAASASSSIKQTGAPSQAALEAFMKSLRTYTSVIDAATATQKKLNQLNEEQQGGKERGLGRLPLASVGAALFGNKSAGARVGYALGNLLTGRGVQGGEATGVGGAGKGGGGGGIAGAAAAGAASFGGVPLGGLAGLGVGLGASALIGAGFKASPIGTEVITKPLEILAATIGGQVLPALVQFGTTLLDLADNIKAPLKAAGNIYDTITAPIDWAVKGAGWLGEKTGLANVGKSVDRFGQVDEVNAKRAAEGKPPMSPAEHMKFLATGGEGMKDKNPNENRDLIVKEIIARMGGQPKVGGNLADIAKEVQMAAFQSGLENKLEKIWMENVKILEANKDVAKAIRGE